MGRRIVFGLIYFVVLYFGTCAVVGAVAGARASSKLPANAHSSKIYEVSARAAAETVTPIREYVLFGAALLGGGGSLVGVLPGTRTSLTAE